MLSSGETAVRSLSGARAESMIFSALALLQSASADPNLELSMKIGRGQSSDGEATTLDWSGASSHGQRQGESLIGRLGQKVG